jgi:hypothetical protein
MVDVQFSLRETGDEALSDCHMGQSVNISLAGLSTSR